MQSFRYVFPLLIIFVAEIAYAVCSVSTTPVNFGAYDAVSAVPTVNTGSISIACGEVPPPFMEISIGPSANSGGFNPRQLRSGQELMNYNLYSEETYSKIWGDGTGSTYTVRKKPKGWKKPRIINVYGLIPAGQDVAVGTYMDTLTVTVIW